MESVQIVGFRNSQTQEILSLLLRPIPIAHKHRFNYRINDRNYLPSELVFSDDRDYLELKIQRLGKQARSGVWYEPRSSIWVPEPVNITQTPPRKAEITPLNPSAIKYEEEVKIEQQLDAQQAREERASRAPAVPGERRFLDGEWKTWIAPTENRSGHWRRDRRF